MLDLPFRSRSTAPAARRGGVRRSLRQPPLGQPRHHLLMEASQPVRFPRERLLRGGGIGFEAIRQGEQPRRQVAHHAGEHWRPLLDYPSGKLKHLPEG